MVSACITGPRTTGQLQQNLRAADLTLDEDTLAELDRIWPGPGTSPEAYSW